MRTDCRITPMVATGEWLTEALRRFDLECAATTCPDMTIRQYEAILDGRGRLVGDTKSGVFYEEGSLPSPAASGSGRTSIGTGGASDD